jgi:hypothetical protein
MRFREEMFLIGLLIALIVVPGFASVANALSMMLWTVIAQAIGTNPDNPLLIVAGVAVMIAFFAITLRPSHRSH